MTDPIGDLFADPALAAEAAAARAEWRAEEEEWTRAAAERWAHRRTIAEVAREYLHRGDTVDVVTGGRTFRGTLSRVGDDWLQVETSGGPVDVALACGAATGDARSLPAPVVIRRSERATAGGRRDDGGVATFRARLLEHEARGEAVVVGSNLVPEEIHGVLTVGADHVIVSADGTETALARVGWVQPEPLPFSAV